MPRPWEDKDFSKEEMFRKWGPEKVITRNGQEVITREQFYDRMVAQGWNKEGDDVFIAAMYTLGAHAVEQSFSENPYFTDILKIDATTHRGREEAMNITDVQEISLLPFADSDKRYALSTQVMDIRKQRRKEKLSADLLTQGFDIYKNEEDILDVMSSLHEYTDHKSYVDIKKRFRKEAYSDAADFLRGLIRVGDDKEIFRDDPDLKKRLEAEEQRLNKIVLENDIAQRAADDLEETKTLREYMKRMIENGLYDVMKKKGEDGQPFDPGEVGDKWGVQIDDPEDEEVEPQNIQKSREHLKEAYYNLLNPLVRCIEDNPAFERLVREGKNTDSVTILGGGRQLPFRGGPVKGHIEQVFFENIGIMDTLGTQIEEGTLKTPADMFSEENAHDPYWVNFAPPMKVDEMGELQDLISQITNLGLNMDELLATDKYNKIMSARNLPRMDDPFSPIPLIKMVAMGRAGWETAAQQYNVYEFQTAWESLNAIKEEYQAAIAQHKEENFMDMGAEMLGFWFKQNGYNMLDNTMSVTNGFDEIEIKDGDETKKVHVIRFTGEVDTSKIDRDLVSYEEYQDMIKLTGEASKLYQENKKSFENLVRTSAALERGTLSGGTLDSMVKDMEKDKKGMAAINQFRHMLYQIKAADDDVCKLVDIKNKNKAVQVEALKANTEFNKEMVTRETVYLDMCVDMLREPAGRVNWNSREYKKIQESVEDLKKAVQKEYPNNDEAREAYVRATDKVLKNISLYRDHKAKSGIKKQDGMHDKLVAVERVDKLLRTRYKSLAQREYEDNISGLSELFDVKVEENIMGDDYVYAKATEKIANMKKSVTDLQKEFDLNVAKENGRESVGTTRKALDLFTSVMESYKAESPKKEEQNTVVATLKKNDQLTKALKNEEEFRAGKDPKDGYGKEQLISSAEKTLYLLAVEDKCVKVGMLKGAEEGKIELDHEMAAYNKSSRIKTLAFKNMYLTDKDFNKEFQKRVLEGAAKGEIGAENIARYRDEALEACYTKYKGKNIQDLNKLSGILGSEQNSDMYAAGKKKSKVGINGLLQEEKKNVKKEPKKETHTIKRSSTITEDHNKKKAGHTKG